MMLSRLYLLGTKLVCHFPVYIRTMSESTLPKVVVRRLDTESRLSMSFNYGDEDLGMKERQFNFNRDQDEPLSILKARIITNIDKIRDKKKKRKKAKQSNEETVTDLEIIELQVEVLHGDDLVGNDVVLRNALQPGSSLKVGNTKYEIAVNPPMVRSIALPTNTMAGFAVYPKFEVEFANISECTFEWFTSKNFVMCQDHTSNPESSNSKDVKTAKVPVVPKPVLERVTKWIHAGNGNYYITRNEDIGKKLQVICTPRRGMERGIPVEAESSVVVTPGPGRCPFERRHQYTVNRASENSFRVVTYNILADLYADSDFSRTVLFPYCPAEALSIDYRKQLLLKEIIGYNADLICLQEVDKKVYDSDLKTALHIERFSGIFDLKGGQSAEGLACFYRNEKFRLIESYNIILGEALKSSPLYSDLLDVVSKNERLLERILVRTTALQVAVLESLECKGNFVCIGNTHLYFRPDADHIRLIQAYMCIRYIEQLVALTNVKGLDEVLLLAYFGGGDRNGHDKALKLKNPQANVAVVLCGDFNSSPEFGVFRLITTQYAPEDLADWMSNDEEIVKELSCSHTLNLSCSTGTPEFTNFTVGFVGCLDYIFHDNAKLSVNQVIPMPTEEELKQHIAVPSIVMPSDHIALICDLRWKEQTTL